MDFNYTEAPLCKGYYLLHNNIFFSQVSFYVNPCHNDCYMLTMTITLQMSVIIFSGKANCNYPSAKQLNMQNKK